MTWIMILIRLVYEEFGNQSVDHYVLMCNFMFLKGGLTFMNKFANRFFPNESNLGI